jgi:hypothetical protein
MMGWAYEEGGYEGKRIRFEKKMHDNKDKRNNRFLTLFDISMSDISKVLRPIDIFIWMDVITILKGNLRTVS